MAEISNATSPPALWVTDRNLFAFASTCRQESPSCVDPGTVSSGYSPPMGRHLPRG